MTHSVAWSPYVGSSSYILAGFLLLVTCVLTYFGFRLRHAIAVKGPGKFLGSLSTPIPIALNMLSKVVAFASAVSLFTTAPVYGERAKAGSSRPGNPQ
jgi:hypothetical protein